VSRIDPISWLNQDSSLVPVRGRVSSNLDKTQESDQVTLSGTCKVGSHAMSGQIT
jgi:hypothetical protein